MEGVPPRLWPDQPGCRHRGGAAGRSSPRRGWGLIGESSPRASSMGDESERTARLVAEIARRFEFAAVEDWRWIKEGESPAVAMIRADGRRYVARTFTDETDAHRADDVAGLLLHLASAG